MRMVLDRQSTRPLYRQVEEYLRSSIENGELPANSRLPATRQLARDLGVSRITIENAYAELLAHGLVATHTGQGTFVLPRTHGASVAGTTPTWPLWQANLEQISLPVRPSGDLARGGTISFAVGSGDPHVFPVDDFRRALSKVMLQDPEASLDYGEAAGYSGLRSTIAQVLCSQGLKTRASNILITAGSQQAISLVAQVLLKPGDTVLVEEPTYGRALELFKALRYTVEFIPTDSDGMVTEKLEPILQKFHPKLIYTIPNFQNPSGTCLSGQRRRELIALADRYNIPILEDDFVGDLRYEGSVQPSLKALDPGGRVIYTSTFSKMLLPGLRIGFAVADGPIYEALVYRKQVQDLATSNLIQRALESYISIGSYQAHLRRSCRIYRKRRDVMLAAIEKHMPHVVLHRPLGGLFVWLRLPEGVKADELLPVALGKGVCFEPGTSFSAEGRGVHHLRLNFAALPEDAIVEGIKRLGTALNTL